MKNALRITALVLGAVLLFVVVAAPLAIACEVHHECTGEDCPVCALILAFAQAVSHLSRILALAALSVPVLLAFLLPALTLGTARNAYDPARNGIRLLN